MRADRPFFTGLASRAPTGALFAGEIGENDCAGSYIDPLTSWLNTQGTGYLAWTWDDWNVGCNPVLITDYTGTPTAYGAAYKAILAALP